MGHRALLDKLTPHHINRPNRDEYTCIYNECIYKQAPQYLPFSTLRACTVQALCIQIIYKYLPFSLTNLLFVINEDFSVVAFVSFNKIRLTNPFNFCLQATNNNIDSYNKVTVYFTCTFIFLIFFDGDFKSF